MRRADAIANVTHVAMMLIIDTSHIRHGCRQRMMLTLLLLTLPCHAAMRAADAAVT